jgi:hypothetical protein
MIRALPWAAPTPPANVSTGAGSGVACLIGVLVIVALALWLFVRHRSGAAKRGGGVTASSPDPSDPYGTIPTQQLANDANSLLVAADDSLKTSEQELTFATTQYGEAATAEFSAALAESQADVAASFHLRQMLDDEVPDDEKTQRAWYVEIIQRCRVADDRLDAQVDAFDKLRNLEANVESMIPDLVIRRDDAAARLPQAQATYESLAHRYAPSATRSLSNSSAQMRERLDFADRSLDQANESLTAGNRSLAALAIRATEEALGQVDMIFGSVTQLSANLDHATSLVASALADVEADIAAGQAAVSASGSGAPGGASAGTVDLAAAVAGASQVTASVRAETTESLPDPFAALRRLEHVNVRLSQALDTIHDAASRAERARAMLEQAIPAARAEISAVTNFITTRRGAVGSDARTRLAEAQRHLEQAITLRDRDPVAALTAAQMADALAEQAGQLANDDVESWSQPGLGGGISMGGLGGAVLGGILIEGMLGGRRGGFGGDGLRNGGFSGGGFNTGFGWGGRLPGSFGGQGTRVRVRL